MHGIVCVCLCRPVQQRVRNCISFTRTGELQHLHFDQRVLLRVYALPRSSIVVGTGLLVKGRIDGVPAHNRIIACRFKAATMAGRHACTHLHTYTHAQVRTYEQHKCTCPQTHSHTYAHTHIDTLALMHLQKHVPRSRWQCNPVDLIGKIGMLQPPIA
jgi:hypothetical protein